MLGLVGTKLGFPGQPISFLAQRLQVRRETWPRRSLGVWLGPEGAAVARADQGGLRLRDSSERSDPEGPYDRTRSLFLLRGAGNLLNWGGAAATSPSHVRPPSP